MKKIICLAVLPGLVLALFLFINSSVQASPIDSGNTGNKDSHPAKQEGSQWYDEAWHYRRAVVVSSSQPSELEYYQVLVKLDSDNFDFNRAQPGGSDVRFTDSDGTTELSFWIESWTNQLAYVWVRLSRISPGNTTIYLYYGNPEATNISSGTSTFDRFDDDWSGISGTGSIQNQRQIVPLPGQIFSPFYWTILGGTPDVISGELILNNGAGIKSNSSHQFAAMGMRANYGLGLGEKWAGFYNNLSLPKTLIGDLNSDPLNLYLINYKNTLSTAKIPRVNGNDWHNVYHIYELRWGVNPGGVDESVADIDHGLQNIVFSQQVPNIPLPVTLYNFSDSNATLKVDWIYVRQFTDPEPSTSIGGEQGLVDLSIADYDHPDPVRKGDKLTYQLTISNASKIDAIGVVVTDSLPASVELAGINSPDGSCESVEIVLCYLDPIAADSFASITIAVTPTVDGVITNTALVGSPGFELNPNNNLSIETTLIDSVPPTVTWTVPVSDTETYFTLGGTTLLETRVEDNDGIDRVEFWWYDFSDYHLIGTPTKPPYEVSFDTNFLQVGKAYWFEAIAYDQAGNSNIPDHRSYIYIIRTNSPTYLPLVNKP